MTTILDEILATKRREVAGDKQRVSLGEMQSQAEQAGPCRDFYAAVTAERSGRRLNVIAEIKKASPSAGLIREDFDPAAIATIYQNAGAAALSVLTDGPYFQGDLAYLGEVREAVDLPILRKDFIVDAYQIYQARARGADAVLLIAEALTGEEISEFADLANSLGMTVLAEVHSEAELKKLRGASEFPRRGNRLLGINNRDLKRMVTELDTSLRLKALIGDMPGLVSESGIKSKGDVERLSRAGFSGVLIGETLMKADDIGEKFTEIFG